MKKTLLFVLVATMSLMCQAQNKLGMKVYPADEAKGTSERYLYTDGQMAFTLTPVEDDVKISAMLLAPKGKKFRDSTCHLCTIELCTAEGEVLKTVKYYTGVQKSNDRLLFYEDSMQGYHAENCGGNKLCNCYASGKYTLVDLWNFICNEDGFVRVKSQTKDGDMEDSFWTVVHK